MFEYLAPNCWNCLERMRRRFGLVGRSISQVRGFEVSEHWHHLQCVFSLLPPLSLSLLVSVSLCLCLSPLPLCLPPSLCLVVLRVPLVMVCYHSNSNEPAEQGLPLISKSDGERGTDCQRESCRVKFLTGCPGGKYTQGTHGKISRKQQERQVLGALSYADTQLVISISVMAKATAR